MQSPGSARRPLSPSDARRSVSSSDGTHTFNSPNLTFPTDHYLQNNVSSIDNFAPVSADTPSDPYRRHDISNDFEPERAAFPSDHYVQRTSDYVHDPAHNSTPQLQRFEKHPPPQQPIQEPLNQPTSKNDATIITQAAGHQLPEFEVDWDGDQDPQNPMNWPLWYKGVTIGVVSWATFCVVLYSTSYTTGLVEMGEEFNVSSKPVVTLGLTSFLFGLALGSMVLAPLSEMYGRWPVYLGSMCLTTVLIIPCALATSLEELIIIRFFGAFFGAAMVSISPGTITDISKPEYRALGLSIWAIGPLNGPTFGPLVGGFSTEYLGWRWTNWIVMILSGTAIGLLVLMKESYGPAILRKKAQRRRKETNDDRYWCRHDEKKVSFIGSLKVNLSRPFIMIVTEPICLFWDIYIAIIYGILYLCFVAYPIVFGEIRGWSNGMTGLSFLGIAIGCFITLGMEPLIRRMIMAHRKDPKTGKVAPEAMVSVVCIAAVLSPIGELWFAWTCVPPVHWIWPIAAGIPFGAGNTAIFTYGSNYLAQSYGIYAASALAGNSVLRSILGGVMPLAGPAMYKALNPHWAGTLLGLIQVACIPIPILFYKYGYKIRMQSSLIRSMQAENEKRATGPENGIKLVKRVTSDVVDVAKRASVMSSRRSSKRFSTIDEDFDTAAKAAGRRESGRYERMDGDEEMEVRGKRGSRRSSIRHTRPGV